MSLIQYTEDQFNRALKIIYHNLIVDMVKSESPQAYILGGQSGAGKTTLHEIYKDKLDYNAIVINGDDFRKFHPNFDKIQKTYGTESVLYTQEFVNQIVEKLIDRLGSEKYNLIIEGTLRTADIPLNTCNQLKNNGYSVELSIIAVKPEISWKSTQLRYHEMKRLGMEPRTTPRDHHDNVVKEISTNIDNIYKSNTFDNITIYQRNRNCIYNQRFTPDITPSSILNSFIESKNMSLDEKQQFFHINSLTTENKDDKKNKNKQYDPYVYFNNVLKNKLGIQDGDLLKKVEADITAIKLLSVDTLISNNHMDFDHLKKLHIHIFSELYAFAGEIRKVPVAKSEKILDGDTIRYTLPKDIERTAKDIIRKMDLIDWKTLSIDKKAEHFSKLTAALWQVHPFRDGNTRTIMTFAYHYAEIHGFPLDKEIFRQNVTYARESLVAASDRVNANPKFLIRIMKDSMTIGEEISIMQEITNAGYKPTNKLIQDMKNLNHNFNKIHTVKELKDIYKNINMLSGDDKKIVESVVNDFINEEKKEKNKQNNKAREVYPEP